MALSNTRHGRAVPGTRRVRPYLDCLEDRTVPAVRAIFNDGILTVLGDAANNNLVVKATAAGDLQVTERGQLVTIRSLLGSPTRANLRHVVMEGGAGNDVLLTDASLNTLVNGTLAQAPTASLLGGRGADTLTVGHGGIVGGLAGIVNGVVVGPVVGNSYMDGGDGDDMLTSGFGNDVMLGGAGNDTYLWPPGTLTDVWDGGSGIDTAIIVGNDTFLGAQADDEFVLSASGSRVLFQRVNLVQFSVDIGTTENIVLRPGAGNDIVRINNLAGVASVRKVTVEGAAGDDLLDGSAQANRNVALVLDGGDGNDMLRGGAGKDVLNGGTGDDDLNGGLGADVLHGDDGNDRLDGGGDGAEDVLIGGAGADTFVKRRNDLVLDFDALECDVLQQP